MKILRALFSRNRPDVTEASVSVEFTAPLAPQEALCIVGDIHGRADLTAKLLDFWATQLPGVRLVTLGDYVDRGDHTADVLRQIYALNGRDDVVNLAGNHEAMMIEFLDDPVANGPRWLRHGGLQSLASFGLRGLMPTMAEPALLAARDQLRQAMDAGMEDWLRALPVTYHSGNLAMLHAGADPALPIPLQARQTLLWGHRDFAQIPRDDGIWVAHGHTIVPKAAAEQGRIALDTGAWATGRLSYALASPDGLDLRTV